MFHLAAAKQKSSTVLSYIYVGADIDRGAALAPQLHIVFIEESDSMIWFLWFMRPTLSPATHFYLRWLCPESEPHSSCVRPHLPLPPHTISKLDKRSKHQRHCTLQNWVFRGEFVIVTTKFQRICRLVRQLFHMLVSPLLFVCLSWSICLHLYSSLLRLLPHSLSIPCKNQWLLIDLGHDWRSESFLFFPGKTEKGIDHWKSLFIILQHGASAAAGLQHKLKWSERVWTTDVPLQREDISIFSFRTKKKKKKTQNMDVKEVAFLRLWLIFFFSDCPIGVNTVSSFFTTMPKITTWPDRCAQG